MHERNRDRREPRTEELDAIAGVCKETEDRDERGQRDATPGSKRQSLHRSHPGDRQRGKAHVGIRGCPQPDGKNPVRDGTREAGGDGTDLRRDAVFAKAEEDIGGDER